jgi:hypothetical protein
MDGDIPQLFHVCCGGGLEAVKQFVAQNRISAADVRNCGVLCMVCATGHLKVAVWLTDQFGLAPADVDSAMAYLTDACGIGHLDMAQWIVHTFEITVEHLREYALEPFVKACQKGHLVLAQWLAAEFDLTAEDIRAEGALTALRLTCVAGHIAVVVEWLVNAFELTAADYNAEYDTTLCQVCFRGDVDMAMLLVNRFNLAAAYSYADKATAVSVARLSGSAELVRSLTAAFGLAVA